MRLLAVLIVSLALAPAPRVVATIPTPPQPIGIAFGAGSAWTASFDFGTLSHVVPR